MLKVYYSNISHLINKKGYEKIYNSLPSFRQQKANSYYQLIDRVRSVASFYLLLKLLDDNKIKYSNDSFLINKNGKPYLKDNPCYFNYAHSGNYVIAAISDYPLGVDVEIIKKKNISNNLVNHVFNQNELLIYKTKKDKLDFFYKTWVKKESYVKYTSEGLAKAFPIIDFNDRTISSLFFKVFRHNQHYFAICTKTKRLDLLKCIRIQ